MPRETGVQSQVESSKIQKMVLNAALLNTQHYKVRKKGSGAIQERSSALSYTSV